MDGWNGFICARARSIYYVFLFSYCNCCVNVSSADHSKRSFYGHVHIAIFLAICNSTCTDIFVPPFISWLHRVNGQNFPERNQIRHQRTKNQLHRRVLHRTLHTSPTSRSKAHSIFSAQPEITTTFALQPAFSRWFLVRRWDCLRQSCNQAIC